ncbi:C40 family peptidase [Nonomuraea fuscirosea]|uniref:C40 family peptidase n=1 Tax=Nonomuraea fuscirosea TaxID=1291556 RepID=UPI0034228914
MAGFGRMAGVMTVTVTAAVTVAVTGTLAVPGAALADPTPAQARAKLVKLNEQADQLVERFNQATETYGKARRKYEKLDTELRAKQAQAEALRGEVAELALNDYQMGGPLGWQRYVVQGRPEAMLGGMASLEQIMLDRAAKVRAFHSATEDLRKRRDTAKGVLAEAESARDDVRDEKSKVDKLVGEQTKLLRRLGAFTTGNPRSTGITYTGPASGNARQALQFAFGQVGKPYRYGGTGPGSWDCSGLAQAAWRAAGVRLPRTTYTQWSWGAARRVPVSQAQPGDLLFSRGLGHMGLYVGDGKMVHAPQTGDVVKVVVLDDYWRNRLIGAVRP